MADKIQKIFHFWNIAIDMFGNGSRLTWILCSYNYWPAQNILAYAMFHYISEKCSQSER